MQRVPKRVSQLTSNSAKDGGAKDRQADRRDRSERLSSSAMGQHLMLTGHRLELQF